MRQFSRLLRRRTLFEVSATTLVVAWLFVLGAYAYYASQAKPEVAGLAAAGILLLVAATSFLYAWREPKA
jgi:CHASE2 domain-containing sensor protein